MPVILPRGPGNTRGDIDWRHSDHCPHTLLTKKPDFGRLAMCAKRFATRSNPSYKTAKTELYEPVFSHILDLFEYLIVCLITVALGAVSEPQAKLALT